VCVCVCVFVEISSIVLLSVSCVNQELNLC